MSSTPWYQRRSAAWVAVVLCGGVAVAMLWHGATEPRDRTTALVVGGFLASVTALLLAGLRRPVMRWEATRLDDRPAWTLRLGQPASALTLALVATSTTVLLGAWAASGGAGGVLLLGLPTLCFVVLVLEAWRIVLVRQPRLTVGVDVVELRSTGLDARMGWDHVRSVRYADSALYLAITLEAAAPAPSYRGRRRRWLLPTDRRPDPTRLSVRVTLVADPPALLTLLRELHEGGASVRAARLAGAPPSP